MQTMNTLMSLLGEISIMQTAAGLGITGGTLWGAWKWMLSSRIETLKLASDTQFRYRELEDARRNKFQADVMAMVDTIRNENKELRIQLAESEDARLRLITKISELQITIAELKAEVVRLTTELALMRGVPNNAAHG